MLATTSNIIFCNVCLNNKYIFDVDIFIRIYVYVEYVWDLSMLALLLTNEGDALLIWIDWQLIILYLLSYIKYRQKFEYDTYQAYKISKCGYKNQTMLLIIQTSYILIYVINFFCLDVMVILNCAYPLFLNTLYRGRHVIIFE